MNMRRLLALALALAATGSGVQAQWTRTSGPEGGYVRSIAVDGEKVYAEFWNTWFHHYDGTSWIKGTNPITDQLFVAGSSLLGNKFNGNVVRSTDKGGTWGPLSGNAPDNVLATDNGKVYGSRMDTVLVSGDEGATWSVAGDLPLDGAMADVLGAHGDTLLASSIAMFRNFRSTDGGKTWAELKIDSAGLFPAASFLRSGNTFYAWFHTQGVYRSDDGGITWQGVNQGFETLGGNYPAITSMAVAGDTLWASTTTEVFRFDGTSWKKFDAGYLEMGRFAGEGHNLYCGSNAGVFHSTDLGVTWNSLNSGLIATYISAFGMAGNALLSNSMNGIHRTTDGGTTWSKVSQINAEQFLTSGDMLYVRSKSYTGLGIYRSADSGLSWTPSNDGISESLHHLTAMAGADQTLLAGFYDVSNFHGTSRWEHGGIARSSDGGRSWTAGNTGLPVQDNTPVPVIDLATDGSSFLASTLRGLYRSTNGGASWNRSQNGLPAQLPYRGVLAHNEGSYYIAVERTIYHSTDGGESWEDYGQGLDSTVIVQSFSVAGNRVFAHMSSSQEPYNRLYILQGDTWMDINGSTPLFNGPEPVPDGVTFMAITAMGKTLYAGSSGQGVWRHAMQSDTILNPASADGPGRNTASGAMLRNASPNPFSSGTAIQVALPARAHVRLSVADATGREVALLSEQIMDAGEKTFRFDGGTLPSGVYFVRLMAAGRLQTIPVVLAR